MTDTIIVDTVTETIIQSDVISDHGYLSGLSDDDHTQYHNNTRGDARYFKQSEFVNTSAGAGDAGKPVVLDDTGNIDATMINDSDIDHASITNTHNLTTDIDHDSIANSGGNQHIDWTSASDNLDTSGTVDAASGFLINGTSINTAGTLSNVAYENQANTFTLNQTIDLGGLVDSTLNINGSVNSSIKSTATDKLTVTHNGATPIEIDTNGNVVFNEAGADVDFRVESDNNANMIFVDGGNDRVGFGTNAPEAIVHLYGSSAATMTSETSHGRKMSFGAIDSSPYTHVGTASDHTFSFITNDVRVGQFNQNGGLVVGKNFVGTNPPTNGAIIEGSVGIGQTSFGTNADKVIALSNGTAPTTSPADAVQVYSADRGGTAGKAGLHIRTEDGTTHVFSDRVGIGTATPSADIHVVSSVSEDPVVMIENTNDDNKPPKIEMYKTTSSPANFDQLGEISFIGKNSAGSSTQYGFMKSLARDITASSEAGLIYFYVRQNGTARNYISMSGNLAADSGIVTINDDGVDVDFRVESNNNANMFFVDGGNDRVGIGTATPEDNLTISCGDAKGLSIKSSIRPRITLYPSNSAGSGSNSGQILFKDNNGDDVWYISSDKNNNGTDKSLFFYDSSSGGGDYTLYLESPNGNIGIGGASFGTNATRTICLSSGIAPTTSPADATQVWSADQAAGNACLHTRTEGGAVIKLYQQSHIVDADGSLADITTKFNTLLSYLENNGLLASS